MRGAGRPVKLGAPKVNFHIWLKFGVRVQIFLKLEDFEIIVIVKDVIARLSTSLSYLLQMTKPIVSAKYIRIYQNCQIL